MVVARDRAFWWVVVFDLGFDDSGSKVGTVQVRLEYFGVMILEIDWLRRVCEPLGRASGAKELRALNHDAGVDSEALLKGLLADHDVERAGEIESGRYSQSLVSF
jgi:hypothetical protein